MLLKVSLLVRTVLVVGPTSEIVKLGLPSLITASFTPSHCTARVAKGDKNSFLLVLHISVYPDSPAVELPSVAMGATL